MTENEKILQYLKRINEKLTVLLSDTKKEKVTWVKASVITRLTGWSSEQMRRARNNGYVKFKKDKETGIWYALESINPLLMNRSR